MMAAVPRDRRSWWGRSRAGVDSLTSASGHGKAVIAQQPQQLQLMQPQEVIWYT